MYKYKLNILSKKLKISRRNNIIYNNNNNINESCNNDHMYQDVYQVSFLTVKYVKINVKYLPVWKHAVESLRNCGGRRECESSSK